MHSISRMPGGSVAEVFLAFLRLGLVSFGGPVAHLGYFQREFVERRRWLGAAAYAELVALCQFLPGPASSQVGMAIGLHRAGAAGLLAAWAGFTLPSAALLILFAMGLDAHAALGASGWIHGLKLAAVAVAAHAVLGMARALCPDRPRAALAIGAACVTLALSGAAGQVGAIGACAVAGALWLRLPPHHAIGDAAGRTLPAWVAVAALVLLAGLLFGLPVWARAADSEALRLLSGVFRAGALVFGGGHVVLPLLHSVVVEPGFVGEAQFLAGYGATQAVPGPLFTFAAYLGAVAGALGGGWRGGLALLLAIFLPALLLLLGALPFWHRLRRHARMRAAVAGANAGVVGILGSALYDPVWLGAVHSRADFGLVLVAFGLLVVGRVSPMVVALAAAAGGALLAAL